MNNHKLRMNYFSTLVSCELHAAYTLAPNPWATLVNKLCWEKKEENNNNCLTAGVVLQTSTCHCYILHSSPRLRPEIRGTTYYNAWFFYLEKPDLSGFL